MYHDYGKNVQTYNEKHEYKRTIGQKTSMQMQKQWPPSAMKGIGYFQNLRNFLRFFLDFFLEIFWEDDEFFWRNFFGEFFWKDVLGGILLEELLSTN